MLSAEDEFIIDAVAHPYHLGPDNYADVDSAATISELTWQIGGTGAPDSSYDVPHDVYLSDWSVEDVANVLFKETPTDIAVVHALPIYAFKDGFCSVEKAAEAVERWPHRFRAYASVDPLKGEAALKELDRQIELLKPTGIKVYPTSWDGQTVSNWKMNDPKVAFPFYERALKHGIKSIAVHKAIPLGPIVVGDAFVPTDIEGAAGEFPELNFEIVHGGVSFAEETAWLLARFPNVYVNLEVSNIILERRPRTFSRMLLDMVKVGGTEMYDRFFWGSGCVLGHPRPTIEAFCRYQIPEDLLEDAGLFGPVGQLTDDHKRKMLSGTYAAIHGIDIEATREAIANDEFSRARQKEPNPEPWSSCSKWGEIQRQRGAA